MTYYNNFITRITQRFKSIVLLFGGKLERNAIVVNQGSLAMIGTEYEALA